MATIQDALHGREDLSQNQSGPYPSVTASQQAHHHFFHDYSHGRHHGLGPGHPFPDAYAGRPQQLPRPRQHPLSAEPYDAYDVLDRFQRPDSYGQGCPPNRLHTSFSQTDGQTPPAQTHQNHPHQQHYHHHHHHYDNTHPYPHHQYASVPYSSRDQLPAMAPSAEHSSFRAMKHERHVSHSEHEVLRNSENALHTKTGPAATEQLSTQGNKTQAHETPRPAESQHHATIKIVQQPLHARMCGFGEKDRRPIDPPPIVQLILDDPRYNELRGPPKPVVPIKSRRGRKKKNSLKPKHPDVKDHHPAYVGGSTSSAPARTVFKGHDHHRRKGDTDDDHHRENVYELDEDSEMDNRDGSEEDQHTETPSLSHFVARSRDRSDCLSVGQGLSTEPVCDASSRKHGREDAPTLSEPDNLMERQGHSRLEANELKVEDQGDPQEWPRYLGGASALLQDPLYVLHVSLWSEDGSDVRSMISTSGRSVPPKLTRILMGAVVVSPILLNNERGEPGWYFSFPDLSVRTEGVYTLKFSLMRFASFDFPEQGGNHASLLIAETTSQPFTVFSAKKFPGMTESTELSKAFARQGLKIPIRNDLRMRKNADKEE